MHLFIFKSRCKDTIIIANNANFIAMTKERILKFIEIKNITPAIFFKQTGIKRGFLDSDKLNQAVSDRHFAMIIAAYPDINLYWLITGKGEMFLQKSGNTPEEDTRFVKIPADVWETMQIWTESLKRKDDQISQLIEMLKGNNGNSEGAGQGKKDRHAEEAGGRL